MSPESKFGNIIRENVLSETKFRGLKGRIEELINPVKEILPFFDNDEINDLLTSLFRQKIGLFEIFEGRRVSYEIDQDGLFKYIDDKVKPYVQILCFDDSEVVELLLFSMEFTFAMESGETQATMSQRGFRERKREIETIIVNSFAGLIGEVAFQKFMSEKYNVKIELDREITIDRSRHHSDVKNAKEPVSIKTTPNLASIWAECPVNYRVGVFIKASIPSAILLRAFAHVCGMKKLLSFSQSLNIDKCLIDKLEKRLYFEHCGKINTQIKCLICGYFEPSEENFLDDQVILPYLGKIREARYFKLVKHLENNDETWKSFIKKFL